MKNQFGGTLYTNEIDARRAALEWIAYGTDTPETERERYDLDHPELTDALRETCESVVETFGDDAYHAKRILEMEDDEIREMLKEIHWSADHE